VPGLLPVACPASGCQSTAEHWLESGTDPLVGAWPLGEQQQLLAAAVLVVRGQPVVALMKEEAPLAAGRWAACFVGELPGKVPAHMNSSADPVEGAHRRCWSAEGPWLERFGQLALAHTCSTEARREQEVPRREMQPLELLAASEAASCRAVMEAHMRCRLKKK